MCLARYVDSMLNERTFDARELFPNVFESLLRIRHLAETGEPDTHEIEAVAHEIDKLTAGMRGTLYSLSRHEQYSRHLIGIDDKWMAFICRWEKGVSSCIHGHPSFAYYHVLDGIFQMDLYQSTQAQSSQAQSSQAQLSQAQSAESQTLVHDNRLTLKKGDTIWGMGEHDRFDNLIHKVSTREQPGFTLHLFSDDPSKGVHF